jgi:hypothetical protein
MYDTRKLLQFHLIWDLLFFPRSLLAYGWQGSTNSESFTGAVDLAPHLFKYQIF